MIEELSDEFLIKSLVFTLLFFGSYKVTFEMLKNKGASLVISFSISLIGIYYLNEDNVNLIRTAYGGLGLVLLIIFLSFFILSIIYSLKIDSFTRRALLILYGIFTIYIYIENKEIFSYSDSSLIFMGIHLAIVLICILFDIKIKSMIEKRKLKNAFKNS